MTKQVISPEEFIADVNRRLPDHFAYEEGLRVFLVPDGAVGAQASGYDWAPQTSNSPGVVAAVAKEVEGEFDVNPYISRATHS